MSTTNVFGSMTQTPTVEGLVSGNRKNESKNNANTRYIEDPNGEKSEAAEQALQQLLEKGKQQKIS